MILAIKNKYFSVRGDSVVNDLDGNPVYKVNGKLMTITNKKFIMDMSGKRLFTVRNKFFHFVTHKAIIYDETGAKIAMVKDKLFNVNKNYIVAGYKDEIRLHGAMFSLSCTIYKNDEPIGTLRRVMDLRDSFELEADEENMPFLVALVIAIDNITDSKKSNK